MRITLSTSFRDMTYDYYLKQPLSMCKIKLIEVSAKTSRFIYRLNRFASNPYVRIFTNQEIKFVNERN